MPESGRPPGTRLRSALANWAFNTRRRSGPLPDDVAADLAWVSANSPAVGVFSDPAVLRSVLDSIATKLDGGRAAATVVNRKRAVLSNALSYAVELDLLASNLIGSLKWTAPKSSGGVVDRRCVPNPQQAKAFLDAVRVTPRSGPRLHAFFACLYYSALPPEEAVNLRSWNLELPETGWGWITLEKAAPDTGKAWSGSGTQREERQLKHRAVGETRRVPCPPELVAILREHLERFGTDPEGRVFRGERGGELATITYVRLWERARTKVLGEDEAARSPLARRPYDLRHAAVSTWLASSSDPAQLAEWAGTASMFCSRSTPRFSTAIRRRRCVGSRTPCGRPGTITLSLAPIPDIVDVGRRRELRSVTTAGEVSPSTAAGVGVGSPDFSAYSARTAVSRR